MTSLHFQVPQAKEEAVTRDLKAAVSAILQGYGDRQQPVTDASAELHRLCGCLELLLQFDQKVQKSFLGPQKDYWDFLCTGLKRQQGDTEPARFVRLQDKLKTPLGKGRAFIRFCLAHGQLADALQLCLLNSEFTRKWYGPRSPLVCPELQEDILDSLYALNGVAFDLDLQRPDLDDAWPMFSESHCSTSRKTQARRPRRTKASPKKVSAARGVPKGVREKESHPGPTGYLGEAPREGHLAGLPGSEPHGHLSPTLENKRDGLQSPGAPQSVWEPEEGDFQQDQSEGSPRPGVALPNSTPSTQGQGEGPKGTLQEVMEPEAEGGGVLMKAGGQRAIEVTHQERAESEPVQWLLAPSPRQMMEEAMWGSKQESEPWVLRGPGKGEDATTEKPQEQTGVNSVARGEELAEVPLPDMVKSLRHQLWKATEQAQHQGQLLREQEIALTGLQEQLRRCQEEKAQLQAAHEQTRQEAERKDSTCQQELREQRDVIRALKRRVLELTREKDGLWQQTQHLSSMAPGCCVSCSKIFGRLSRRYPCRWEVLVPQWAAVTTQSSLIRPAPAEVEAGAAL
ncbi:RUN and FYVE domain-containing protein 4 [Echinops telfairi]|uniref:RUN and FYVE domain-containing protein 4 n=1 Tax=Echinops telfairi TaxID=9371 RepID=A0ABM0ZQ50_ECHTE|nr:RUN and FYVE domain-containing protein 4 [Echinops telfairi]